LAFPEAFGTSAGRFVRTTLENSGDLGGRAGPPPSAGPPEGGLAGTSGKRSRAPICSY